MRASMPPIERIEFVVEILRRILIKIQTLLNYFYFHLAMKLITKNKDTHSQQASSRAIRQQQCRKSVRVSWQESAKAISKDGNDLLIFELLNMDTEDWDW